VLALALLVMDTPVARAGWRSSTPPTEPVRVKRKATNQVPALSLVDSETHVFVLDERGTFEQWTPRPVNLVKSFPLVDDASRVLFPPDRSTKAQLIVLRQRFVVCVAQAVPDYNLRFFARVWDIKEHKAGPWEELEGKLPPHEGCSRDWQQSWKCTVSLQPTADGHGFYLFETSRLHRPVVTSQFWQVNSTTRSLIPGWGAWLEGPEAKEFIPGRWRARELGPGAEESKRGWVVRDDFHLPTVVHDEEEWLIGEPKMVNPFAQSPVWMMSGPSTAAAVDADTFKWTRACEETYTNLRDWEERRLEAWRNGEALDDLQPMCAWRVSNAEPLAAVHQVETDGHIEELIAM